MASKTKLSEAIKNYEEEKGISHELALKTIEDTMLAAYKKKYGTAEGVEVKFSDDENEVYLQVKKKIVDDVIDDATEIDIDDAREKFGNNILRQPDIRYSSRKAQVRTPPQDTHTEA